MYPKLRNYFTASVLLKKTLSSTPKLTCLFPVVQVPAIQVSPIISNQTIVLRVSINTWLYMAPYYPSCLLLPWFLWPHYKNSIKPIIFDIINCIIMVSIISTFDRS